ncbi:MAG: 50S ribosomal protein L29 [Anaerolineaceae bacterium]|nr:MAG: 50S ribosomal protein L29 [Anaerolineaceae bacterium]
MARLDMSEVRAMTDDQLLDQIEDKRIELFNFRFQQASGQLEDTNLLRYAKRDLARLLTVQRERELAAQITEEGADA